MFAPIPVIAVASARAGRTGRADRTGVALTLVADEELTALRALERSLNIRLGDQQAADAAVVAE